MKLLNTKFKTNPNIKICALAELASAERPHAPLKILKQKNYTYCNSRTPIQTNYYSP